MRILSWNILAQETLSEDDVPFEDRFPKILEILLQSGADILLLQEVDLGSFQEIFQPLFAYNNFASHHINKKRTCSFGNATLWQKKLGEAKQIVERSRCLHVFLSNCLVTNVHFPTGRAFDGYKNRKTHFDSCTKVWQAHDFIILGGDFNEGLWNPFGLHADLKQFGFAFDEHPKLICRTAAGNVHNIDYVCLKSSTWSLIGRTELLLELPLEVDETHPSDHIPIAAFLRQNS